MSEKYQIKNRRVSVAFSVINFCGGIYSCLSLQKFRKKQLLNNPQKILIIQLDGLGDVILSTPAIAELRRNFPNTRVDCLLASFSAEILSLNENVNNLIVYDSGMFYRRYRNIKQMLRNYSVIRRLRKEKYDIIIDLRSDIRSIFVSWLIGGVNRISQDIRSGGFLLTHVVPYTGIKHETERKLDIIRFLSGKSYRGVPRLEIKWSLDDEQIVNTLLDSKKIKNYIVIHANAGWKPQEWPASKFATVSQYIIDTLNLEVIFVGSQHDVNDINSIIDTIHGINSVYINRIHNFAGLLTIRQLAYLLGNSKLFLGIDSGVAHVASAVDAKVVVLFGAQDPRRYGPLSQCSNVIYHKLPCSPCAHTKCTSNNSCMDSISVDEVIGEINTLVKK